MAVIGLCLDCFLITNHLPIKKVYSKTFVEAIHLLFLIADRFDILLVVCQSIAKLR